MKKLTKITMNNTTLIAGYTVDNSKGWPKIKDLKIFPNSQAEELTEVLNPGAIRLIGKGIAEALGEDFNDVEF